MNWRPSTSLEYPGRPFAEVFPALAGIVQLSFSDTAPEEIAAQAEVVFTAVPHQAAMGMIPRFLAQDCRVVDLSADFRFKDPAVYEKWYQPHSAKELLAEAVYGLPEIHGYAVSRARLVGNPGCYPTCVILGLAPLVQNKLIQPGFGDRRLQVRGERRRPGGVAGHPVLRGQRGLPGLQGGGAPPQSRRWSRS